MLIKLKPSGMDIAKTSLKVSEDAFLERYLRELKDSVRVYEIDNHYMLSGSQRMMYKVLYDISCKFDIELM